MFTNLEAVLKNLPQLLGLGVAGVLDLQVSTLGNDLLGGERALGLPPSRVGPPLLDLLDLLLEELIFPCGVHGDVLHVVGSHFGLVVWV